MKQRVKLILDPRTKLFMLLLCVIAASLAPSLLYEARLVVLIGTVGLLCGYWHSALTGIAGYVLLYVLTVWAASLTGTLKTTLLAAFGLFHKVYPCGMMGSLFIISTRVNEFLSAMHRLRIPKRIVIPLAVMIRYFPAIGEDWQYIKDAMRMRDVSPTLAGFLKQPVMTIECIYIPLLTAASKTADELSIAALTRGIENPHPRTCLVQLHFRFADAVIAAAFLFYTTLALLL
ncbi:MAG: energy-coupling factor transporter transmembrane component T [Treponema sp.]